MKISARCLDREFGMFRTEYLAKAGQILESGAYVNGEESARFERSFAGRIGRKHCISLNNGTDALIAALRCLCIGPGDEVLVPCHTFVADFLAVKNTGATPVPADIDRYFCLDPAAIEKSITSKTKAVIAVHLYGHAADMDAIMGAAKKHGLHVIEDCAQAFGTAYRGIPVGRFGDAACFSFYPTKNLGAFGDAGCVLTDSDALAQKIGIFKRYGMRDDDYLSDGVNSRMDELQAGLLNVKLTHFDALQAMRAAIASRYLAGICSEAVLLPETAGYSTHTYHQFVILCARRDALRRHLAEAGIETQIHYKNPPYLSGVYRYPAAQERLSPFSRQVHEKVLSLPIYPGLTEEEASFVIRAVNEFSV